jgi:hypothetical protein
MLSAHQKMEPMYQSFIKKQQRALNPDQLQLKTTHDGCGARVDL